MIKKLQTLIAILLCITSIDTYAQFTNPEAGPVFIDGEVPRIDINIKEEYLEAIADDVWSNEEYEAQFVFTTSSLQDTVENVGVRLRGNTSRSAGKKSIKVSFNTFEPGRKFYGLEKMNINGEHNDPSVIRSKLSWDLSNWFGIPASRSNHVALYVNDEYFGLYINVEHIDEEFIAKRFEDKTGNLWKCLWPADLNYLGFDPNLYKEESNGRRTYDLKTNKTQDNYTDLAHFINVINNYDDEEFQCELERIFDIDNYLKSLAIEVIIAHWDGPTANMNNYYLYHNPCTGKIQLIPYDLDNTFGIDWSGRDWTEISIYNWSQNSFGNGQRPLYDNVMAVEEYKARFDHYMGLLLENYFNEDVLFPYLDEKLELIKSFRQNDPLAGLDYGWDYEDFLESYENSIGDHVRKGMKEYISQRVPNALQELESSNFIPIVEEIEIDWTESVVDFHIRTFDDQEVTEVVFNYSYDGSNWINEELIVMDNEASFSLDVTQEGPISYYVEVRDNDNNARFFPLCQDAMELLGYLESPKLVINEVMSNNVDFQEDDFDEFDDWIELYNMSGTVLPIGKLSLSDNVDNPGKWRLPNTALSPNQYLIIWADDDAHQGDQHANFGIKKSGEKIGLYDAKENHYREINSIEIPELEGNFSWARRPNAIGDFELIDKPTFGFNNDLSSSQEVGFTKLTLYPNPTSDFIFVDSDITLDEYHFSCVDVSGRSFPLELDGSKIKLPKLPSGLYTLLIQNETFIHAKKFQIEY